MTPPFPAEPASSGIWRICVLQWRGRCRRAILWWQRSVLERQAQMSRVILPEPDRAIIARRETIVAELRRLVGAAAVIGDEVGRRAYETDALTAYRRLPLAVVLPSTTEDVSRLLRYCHQYGIKVVARGAGTSLSGGALPAEDAVVIA